MTNWRANITPGEPIVVAVSGGADSVYLLLHLAEVMPRASDCLHVVHINHGLRGADSDGDEVFVRELSTALGVPFHAHRIDTSKVTAAGSPTNEANLRNLRLGLLKATARTVGARVIALGHHADDLAETFLLNALRGSGLAGLGAMETWREVSGNFVLLRPLLELSKREIIRRLSDKGHAWREDSSNASLDYKRNRLRHEVLPLLTSIDPAAVESLAASARFASEASEVITSISTDVAAKALMGFQGESVLVDLDALRAALPNPTLITPTMGHLWRYLNRGEGHHFSFANRSSRLAIEQWFRNPAGEEVQVPLVDNYSFLGSSRFAILSKHTDFATAAQPVARFFPFLLEGAGRTLHQRVMNQPFSAPDKVNDRMAYFPHDPAFSENSLPPSWVLRTMELTEQILLSIGRHKLVRDAMQEAGVPAPLRGVVLGVCDGEGPIWIPGVRRAHRCLVPHGATSYVQVDLR